MAEIEYIRQALRTGDYSFSDEALAGMRLVGATEDDIVAALNKALGMQN